MLSFHKHFVIDLDAFIKPSAHVNHHRECQQIRHLHAAPNICNEHKNKHIVSDRRHHNQPKSHRQQIALTVIAADNSVPFIPSHHLNQMSLCTRVHHLTRYATHRFNEFLAVVQLSHSRSRIHCASTHRMLARPEHRLRVALQFLPRFDSSISRWPSRNCPRFRRGRIDNC